VEGYHDGYRSVAYSRRVGRKYNIQCHHTKTVRYMLLSGLYAGDAHIRFEKPLLGFSVIFCCALGHLFVLFLITTAGSEDPHARPVLV
jgi:hypothetical protein